MKSFFSIIVLIRLFFLFTQPDEIQIAGAQLGQAYQIYRTMASILLTRRHSLSQKFQELMPLTSQSEEFKIGNGGIKLSFLGRLAWFSGVSNGKKDFKKSF